MKEFIIEEHKKDLVAVLEYDVDTLYLYMCRMVSGEINILDSLNIGLPNVDIKESDFKLDWSSVNVVKVMYLGKLIAEYPVKIS